jgi:hypothetical protein
VKIELCFCTLKFVGVLQIVHARIQGLLTKIGRCSLNEDASNFVKLFSKGSSDVAKASRSYKARSLGFVSIVGLVCAFGGYYAGKNNGTIREKFASFVSPAKIAATAPQPEKSAPEMKHADAVKQTDKVELTRLAKIAVEPKSPKPSMPKTEEIEPSLLSVSLLGKDVVQGGQGAADNKHKITLSVAFENLAGKPIRAFEGVLKFTDSRDNKLYSSKIAVSKLIAEGAALAWDEQLDLDKLDETGKRLLAEDQENLKAVFQVKKLFFVDGTVKKYRARG